MSMTKRERLRAAVSGGRPDRVPVSAWGHFYPEETSAAGQPGLGVSLNPLGTDVIIFVGRSQQFRPA